MKITIGKTKSPKKNPKETFKVTFEFMGGDADPAHYETINVALANQDKLEELITVLDDFAKAHKYGTQRDDDFPKELSKYIDGYCDDEDIPDEICIIWPNDPQYDYQERISYKGVSKIQYFDADGIEKTVTLK